MPKETLYLKLDQSVRIPSCHIYVKDLGKLYCRDRGLLDRIREKKVYTFQEGDRDEKVIGVMYLIALLKEEFPCLEVETIGETQTVVRREGNGQDFAALQAVKVCFVSGICFCGAFFTIMAFHNDIGVTQVFHRLYEMVTGQGSDGATVLEISYSVGLAVGILLFFNHVGGRRITQDPTPIEVEMRLYENDVDQAVAKAAEREKKSLDLDG